MSGTFMDGGGNGGDGGGTFGDGGHDHGSHSLHSGHGGDSAYVHGPMMDQPYADGGALGNLLSHSAQNHHGFLAHLLGLDHDGGGDHGGAAVHGNMTGHVSQTAIWSSALQSMKLSDFTHGLNFTPAMGMFFLFAGFVSWLFVLYGIRHNEPLANAVLGTEPGSNPAAVTQFTADRRIVNGTKNAIPIHRPTQLGTSSDNQPQTSSAPSNVMSAPGFQLPFGNFNNNNGNSPEQPFGTPVTNNAGPISEAQPNSPFVGGAGMSIAAPVSAPLDSYSVPSLENQPTTFAFRQGSVTNGNEARYAVSTVKSGTGTKLKFVVNH